MHYEGDHIIRPPSEAHSIILQVTVGCSHNRCTFCGTYKEERFRLKDEAIIAEDLAFAARHCRRQRRVFLADGDVLILPQHRLVSLLTAIRAQLPWVNRVSLYANAKAIRAKSIEQLQELKGLGLDRVYLGLESGHDPTLAAINKGADSSAMIAAGQRVRQAGLFLSVTALLGIAGATDSLAHAEAQAGRFCLPDQAGMLRELRVMVEHLNLARGQLMSNHASNYLPINARLPRDKAAVLATIDQALAGAVHLKPEYLRAL